MSPENKLKLNKYQKNYQKNYRDKKKGNLVILIKMQS